MTSAFALRAYGGQPSHLIVSEAGYRGSAFALRARADNLRVAHQVHSSSLLTLRRPIFTSIRPARLPILACPLTHP